MGVSTQFYWYPPTNPIQLFIIKQEIEIYKSRMIINEWDKISQTIQVWSIKLSVNMYYF